MTKKHASRTRKYTTIKFDAELTYKIRVIVEYLSRKYGRNVTAADYLSDLAEQAIEKTFAETVELIHQEVQQGRMLKESS